MSTNERVSYPDHPWYQDVKIDTIQKAIWAIMCEISYVQKQKSPNLNYTFAGEAALIRALRPYMEKYGVIMSVIDQKDVVFESYTTAKGSLMNRTRLVATIRFYHAPSGTFIDVAAPGEGADTGDKSGNKANTCAYKYALRQTFVIETGDDPDEEASDRYQRAAIQPEKSAASPDKAAYEFNGKTKTFKDLLDYADKNFNMDESRVRTILSKHRKFNPEEWAIYIADLKFAFEQTI